MKTLLFLGHLALFIGLSSAKADSPQCQRPNPDAATLFSMIESPSTSPQEILDFLGTHAIGWDSVNENCQTPFIASLAKKRNDIFKVLFNQYHPDVSALQPSPFARDSIYSFVLKYG